MIIGEAPGADEVKLKRPFVGASGRELDGMLAAVGISRDECYITNVAKARPLRNDIANFFHDKGKKNPNAYLLDCKKVLKTEIDACSPDIIIALGGTALWALTGESAITKWRGSQLKYRMGDGRECWLMPTYHPAAILRQWTWKAIAVQDLRKASEHETWKEPDYDFLLRPDFRTTMDFLDELEERSRSNAILVSGDVETRAGHIACLGIGVSATRAICIPFMDIDQSDSAYWQQEEEVAIILRLVQLFRNPRIRWAFQNGTFDFQYFARHWGTIPHLATDTMLEHHAAWTGDLPKGLDFLSSMYCTFHVYWKEDGKFWDPRYTPEDELWRYNCKDAVVTWEVAVALSHQTEALGLEDQVQFQTLRQFDAVLKMMLRGVRCDRARKRNFSEELAEAYKQMEARLEFLCGQPLNVRSPKQMIEFFYGTLGLPVQKDRKTGNASTNAKILPGLWHKAPWIKPITDLVATMRSVGVFKSTFVDMALDEDERIRCSYNIAGTETLRYSSSENAFRSGGNLQNIPDGKKGEGKGLPNVKNLFIPDPDYVIAEHDLAQADAQVVAWEADDDKLKYIFQNAIDLHLANASDMYDLGIRLEDISDPDGIEWHSKKFGRQRQNAKAGCHATNYGASAHTLAITLGITRRDAQAFIDRWFSEHPGIKDWHDRTLVQLQTERTVRNTFGFRRYYFDRIDNLLPQALAWIPQSTVALVIDNALCNINEQLPEVQPLLQVHDSIVVQYPKASFTRLLPKAHELMTVPVPYPDPLTIPVGVEVSADRWGAKREIPWDFQGEITW